MSRLAVCQWALDPNTRLGITVLFLNLQESRSDRRRLGTQLNRESGYRIETKTKNRLDKSQYNESAVNTASQTQDPAGERFSPSWWNSAGVQAGLMVTINTSSSRSALWFIGGLIGVVSCLSVACAFHTHSFHSLSGNATLMYFTAG